MIIEIPQQWISNLFGLIIFGLTSFLVWLGVGSLCTKKYIMGIVCLLFSILFIFLGLTIILGWEFRVIP